MAELSDLATSAASNTARFPENMQFRSVNDSARELEAMIAREFKDRNMTLAASGSSNAFAVTTNQTITSLYDGLVVGFQANHSITGAATLNVNSLGAKSIVAQSGTALGSGDIVSGQKILVVYRSATQDFQIVGGRVAGSSADTLARIIGVGTVMAWPTSTIPAGWLECNGAAVSRSTYSQLFAKLGTTYGVGDGSTTFNLPNYSGQFLRGYANGSSTDPDRASRTDRGDGTTGDAVGTKQAGATASHSHSVGTLATASDGAHTHTVAYTQIGDHAVGGSRIAINSVTSGGSSGATGSSGSHTHTLTGSTATSGGNETRPTNVSVVYIILALPAEASASTLGVNGLLYTWDTGTTAADPGTGKLRVNNASLSSATTLYINETGADGCGYGPLLATWDDSTATNKGKLHLYKVGALSTFAIYTVTGSLSDAGTYNSLSLTHVASNGSFAAGDQLAVMYVPNGDAGAAGSAGAAGADAGIRWRFDTSTSMADPSASNVRFNNATPASITAIAISRNSAESGSPSMSAWINTWDDSSSTTKGQIIVRDLTDATKQLVFAITSVTDNTTWLQLTVAHVSGSSLPAASDSLAFSFYRTGDQGASGSGSGDVTGQASSVDGEVALFSLTTGKVIKRATGSGLVKVTSGVFGTATGGTDYADSAFKTIAVSGQSDVVADSASDTLTLAAGSNITITTNAGTDTITIAATASGSGDVTGPASSVDSEIALFSSTTGKVIKRASTTGVLKATAGVLTAAAATDLGAGLKSIFIPAAAMVARTTNGAAVGTLEMTTNKNMFRTFDFDTTTQEFVQFAIRMPKSWNESTITAAFVWSHAATATNFGVVWALEAVAVSDADAGDVAFGTAQQIADTGGTTNTVYVTSATPALTVAGSPAAEDWVMFQVKRVPADGSDTMAIDARLHGVTLYYTTDAITEA